MNKSSAQRAGLCVLRKWVAIVAGALTMAPCVQAEFVPLPINTASFNEDVIVERTAPRPVPLATSASMDSGWTNTGYAWYEQGYNLTWPATGLPAPGEIIISDSFTDHQYRLAADYRTNNVVMMEGNSEVDVQLTGAGTYAALSLLLSGMHNGSNGALGYRVVHDDGIEESGTVICPDWMGRQYAAFAAQGRVDVRNFTFAQVNGGVPQLFTADIVLANQGSAVTRLWLRQLSGVRTAVFAVSGVAETGGIFEPIGLVGYNADIIIEAGATRPGWLTGVTTASMEAGRVNTLRTWYERGYAPGDSGLPQAGSLFTNLAAPDHVYVMPGSYEASNAVLLDVESPSAEMQLATAPAVRAISVLTASVNGPTTNVCIVKHADGTSETNTFVSPDWMESTLLRACEVAGRVDLNRSVLECSFGGAPGLFAADVTLTNQQSPVVSIGISKGAAGTRTVIFAVSGEIAVQADPAVLSITKRGDGSLRIDSSKPGVLEYCDELQGTNTVWKAVGNIDGWMDVESGAAARFWRVRR